MHSLWGVWVPWPQDNMLYPLQRLKTCRMLTKKVKLTCISFWEIIRAVEAECHHDFQTYKYAKSLQVSISNVGNLITSWISFWYTAINRALEPIGTEHQYANQSAQLASVAAVKPTSVATVTTSDTMIEQSRHSVEYIFSNDFWDYWNCTFIYTYLHLTVRVTNSTCHTISGISLAYLFRFCMGMS